jgi:hypothetical protein
MKSHTSIGKICLTSTLALAITALAWLPSQAFAQEKGAQKLMKVQTVEDVQKIEAGDTIVMSCPMCKESYAQVSEKTFKTARPEELKTTQVHLCSSCDTKIVTEGVGKQAKDKVVHKCKVCGSEDVSCYVMKKKS